MAKEITELYCTAGVLIYSAAGYEWVFCIIVSAQNKAEVAAERFQVWRLKANPGHYSTLTCSDGNGRIVFIKRIDAYEKSRLVFWCVDNVIMLPNEY